MHSMCIKNLRELPCSAEKDNRLPVWQKQKNKDENEKKNIRFTLNGKPFDPFAPPPGVQKIISTLDSMSQEVLFEPPLSRTGRFELYLYSRSCVRPRVERLSRNFGATHTVRKTQKHFSAPQA